MHVHFIDEPEQSVAVPCFLFRTEEQPFYSKRWNELIPALSPAVDQKIGPDGYWLNQGAVLFSSTAFSHLTTAEALKCALATFLTTVEKRNSEQALVVLDELADATLLQHALRGLLLGAYRFQSYKQEQNNNLDMLKLGIVSAPGLQEVREQALAQAEAIAAGANLARDLVNIPPNDMYPEKLAEQAAALAERHGLELQLLDEKELAQGDYQGILSVGQGSQFPPRMILLRYRPPTCEGPHLGLVGKGVTFDTGGISIKPSKNMHEMKGDMAGAAAVLGVMEAVARLKPNRRITAIIPTAENMVGSRAQRPGDIFRHKSGKYVQVDNTDAEGRLLLIDGLHRAGEEGAEMVVDIATLTGSCMRALGTAVAGLLCNDDQLAAELLEAGESSGDRMWRLPLVEDYREQLDTPHADLRNIGGENAGAITAALFLREFLPGELPWAHLDIAGVFYYEKGWKYYAAGASGVPVAALTDWILRS